MLNNNHYAAIAEVLGIPNEQDELVLSVMKRCGYSSYEELIIDLMGHKETWSDIAEMAAVTFVQDLKTQLAETTEKMDKTIKELNHSYMVKCNYIEVADLSALVNKYATEAESLRCRILAIAKDYCKSSWTKPLFEMFRR